MKVSLNSGTEERRKGHHMFADFRDNLKLEGLRVYRLAELGPKMNSAAESSESNPKGEF